MVVHPNGGVKEQVAGLYAQRLAEQGYITITADAAYIETCWVPRYVEAAVSKLKAFYARTL